MKIFRLKIIAIIFFLTSCYFGNSQNCKNNLVEVNVHVVGKGNPSICGRLNPANFYFVSIRIFNCQDTAISFAIDNECFPSDNFISNIDKDSIYFMTCFGGCGIPEYNEIILPPKKSVQIYSTIASYKIDTTTQKIKVGFRYIPSTKDFYSSRGKYQKMKKFKVYWSNEVLLRDNLYTYEIE